MTSPRDDGWIESTEGDLDPDLTEEAGYSNWEPTSRHVPLWLWQALAVLVILGMLAPVVFVAFR